MFLLEDGAAQSRSKDGAQCYLLKKKMVEALDIAWDTQSILALDETVPK